MVNLSIQTYITLHTNQQQIPLENKITLIQELKCSKLNIIILSILLKHSKTFRPNEVNVLNTSIKKYVLHLIHIFILNKKYLG